MANSNKPTGFEVFGNLLRATVYQSSAACYPGDMVKQTSGGQVGPASAGDASVGVCLSYASASGVDILVADHPSQLFVAQVAASEIDAQTDLGNVCDIVATAGSSTYKLSRMAIDGSTQAAGSSAQVRLLALDRTGANALGQYARVICSISEHQLANNANGV